MLDINGQELNEKDLVSVLCEVVEIEDSGVRVRILNSEQELMVSSFQDEVLGGLVVSSELTKFNGPRPAETVNEDSDGVKRWPME